MQCANEGMPSVVIRPQCQLLLLIMAATAGLFATFLLVSGILRGFEHKNRFCQIYLMPVGCCLKNCVVFDLMHFPTISEQLQ